MARRQVEDDVIIEEPTVDIVEDVVEEEEVKPKASKSSVVLVSFEKKVRAEAILNLVLGGKIPSTTGELAQKDKFSKLLAENDIDAKSAKALVFIYEKIGGLVRSPEEQAKADTKKKEAIASGKKRMIQ